MFIVGKYTYIYFLDVLWEDRGSGGTFVTMSIPIIQILVSESIFKNKKKKKNQDYLEKLFLA